MQHIATIDAKPTDANGAMPPLPERITLRTIDTAHHELVAKAVEAARQWASRKIAGDSRVSLVLVAGPVSANGKPDPNRTGYGCGKTHIARAVQWASYTSMDGVPVAPLGKFFMAKDILALLGDGNTMSDLAPPGTATDFGRVGGIPVLIIDDVGSEGVLPYIAKESQSYEKWARYFEIVNYCNDNGISVVMTGNMRLQELEDYIGGRAWSRLMEMAPAGFMVDMTGVPDWRRQQSGR